MSGLGGGLSQRKITRGCLYLLVALVSVSFFYLLSKEDMRGEIEAVAAASGQSLWVEFKIWQFFTAPFLEMTFIGVLFQGLMLWMFVPSLERWWGTKRFLKFAAYISVTAIVVGTLTALLIPSIPDTYPISGLDPLIYASMIAWGSLFANQQISFFGVIPMTGRQLVIGISCFMLLMVALGQAWAEGASFVAAMTMAWFLTNSSWTPKIWLLKRKQKRLRAHLKVVRDEDDPKGGKGKSKKPTKWLN